MLRWGIQKDFPKALLRQFLSTGLNISTAVSNLAWVVLLLVGEGWERPWGKRRVGRQHMAKQCCVIPPSPDGVLVFLEGT